MLTHVTFTGWDDRTDYVDLASFCRDQRPGTVEIAVLLSSSSMGEDRYPGRENAESILRVAKAHGQRTAVHACGAMARQILEHGLSSDHTPLARAFAAADRVQVNVAEDFWSTLGGPRWAYGNAERLAAGIKRPVIVQVRSLEWPAKVDGVQFLFDRSAGRGEVAEQVPPLTNFSVGYAGGLGPSNVHAFLDRLRPMSRVRSYAPIWIDMESGIRESMAAFPGGPQTTPDTRNEPATAPPTYVSVAKCRQVMDAVRWALVP